MASGIKINTPPMIATACHVATDSKLLTFAVATENATEILQSMPLLAAVNQSANCFTPASCRL
jgi:hypothetical protein